MPTRPTCSWTTVSLLAHHCTTTISLALAAAPSPLSAPGRRQIASLFATCPANPRQSPAALRQLLQPRPSPTCPSFFSTSTSTSTSTSPAQYKRTSPALRRTSATGSMADRLSSRPDGLTEVLADRMEKPELDNRLYRVIRLPNKLEALLIHDADTDKASAAMDVNVGSLADPEEMQGMAHAVEHLLFMGTEKYPGENDYGAYLSKYGGYSNAFTAATSTNYYFELSASSKSNSPTSSANTSQASLPLEKSESPLYGGLDRFSQFFVKPLFDENTLDRELKAVDSENKKNLQSDNWRLMQLSKSLTSPHHPYHLFSTGNYKLLHDDPIARGVKIRDEFIKFYHDHYSANRMKLCVIGREDLDTLQRWVEELFAAVPNQDLPQLRWDSVPVVTEKELCTQIFVKPIMHTRMLDIQFAYPDEEECYESHPSRYISHLIGHEGPGSILAYLKDKGWAEELSAGSHTVCPGTAFFSVGIKLTSAGQDNYLEVIKVVFQYIAMLKEQPPQQWITEESAKLAEIEFRFRQKIPASRTTSSYSGVMQKPYPREWIMSGSSLIRKHDPEAISRGLAALRPDNFRFTLSSQEIPGDWNEKEKWYGTEYKCEKIPPEFLRELVQSQNAPDKRPAELHLPQKNEFLPTRLEVEKKDVGTASLTPKLIRNDPNMRVWWKKDDQFWAPKANFYIGLRSPLADVSPFTACMVTLYKDLVEDSLTTYAYDAELAGLGYGISRSKQMIEVSVSGYNDKLHVLLEKVLLSMRDLDITQERFEIIKERLARSMANFELSEPYRQVNTYTRWTYDDRVWLGREMLDVLPSITVEDVKTFFPQLLKQMHIEVLAHGNLYKEDALRISDMVMSTFKPRPYLPHQWDSDRLFLFPEGSNLIWRNPLKNRDNVNHCLQILTHLGDAQDRKLRAMALLVSQAMEEPVFDVLRTKEQLGYIVGSGPMAAGVKLAHWILIQSEKDCDYLESRVDNFLVEFGRQMKDWTQAEFEAHRVSMINKRLEKVKNLNQESGRFWHHITSQMFDFELVYRDVEQLERLTKEEVYEFYQMHFQPDSKHRAKSAVHLVAQASAEDIAAKMEPSEQRESLAATIGDLLAQLGVAVDASALASQYDKIDVTKGDVESIKSATSEYLTKAAGMAAEQVTAIMEQAQAVLPQVLPALGIKARNTEAELTNGTTAVKKNKATYVEDVKKLQLSLPLSQGPQAVKDLSEFEELEPKL